MNIPDGISVLDTVLLPSNVVLPPLPDIVPLAVWAEALNPLIKASKCVSVEAERADILASKWVSTEELRDAIKASKWLSADAEYEAVYELKLDVVTKLPVSIAEAVIFNLAVCAEPLNPAIRASKWVSAEAEYDAVYELKLAVVTKLPVSIAEAVILSLAVCAEALKLDNSASVANPDASKPAMVVANEADICSLLVWAAPDIALLLSNKLYQALPE